MHLHAHFHFFVELPVLNRNQGIIPHTTLSGEPNAFSPLQGDGPFLKFPDPDFGSLQIQEDG